MDDDDLGLDFDLDSPPKKPPPRKGRRSDSFAKTPPNGNSELTSPSSRESSAPLPPPRSRKTGGWADDSLFSAKRSWKRRPAQSSTSTPAFDSLRNQGKLEQDESDSEIPAIPDLDEVKDEEFVSQIAHAPSVAVNRVATYQELDSDLLKHTAFATLDGIDLRLLTKRLAPEHQIKEEDDLWTWDILFTDVSSQLNKELEGMPEKEVEAPIF